MSTPCFSSSNLACWIRKLSLLALVVLLFPWSQATAETLTATFVDKKAVLKFANNVTFVILASQTTEGATATVELKEVTPNILGNLMAPELSGTCIKRTGTNKCPRFDWEASSGVVGPYEVRIFYANDNPLAVNPRIFVCDSGLCTADVTGYFPFAPTDIGPDAGYVRPTDTNSIFFAGTLALSQTVPGVATILDPLAGSTITDPEIATGGSNLPLKVQLCHGTSLDPCYPITDAQILVSIYRIEPSFQIVFPPAFPGASTPPSIMTFVASGPWYQFNWKVPEDPGLYNVSFIFLTNNTNVLTGFVRVPTP